MFYAISVSFQTQLVRLQRLGDRVLLQRLPVGGEVGHQPGRGGLLQWDRPVADTSPHLEPPQSDLQPRHHQQGHRCPALTIKVSRGEERALAEM